MKKWLAALALLLVIAGAYGVIRATTGLGRWSDDGQLSLTDGVNRELASRAALNDVDLEDQGYREVVLNWSHDIESSGGSDCLTTEMVNSLAIGQKCRIVLQDGYRINIAEYNDQGDNVGYAFNEFQTGDVEFTVARKSFKILLANDPDGAAIPDSGYRAVQLYAETADRQYGVGKYYGKRISIMGDSLSTFGGSVMDENDARYSEEGNRYTYPGNKCRYPQNSLEVIDPHQTYWMRVIDYFHMELGVNDSIAGSRVSWDGKTESNSVGAEKHMASQTRIDHLGLNGTPDIILINGGTNDVSHHIEVGTVDDSDIRDITDFSQLPVTDFSSAYKTMLLRMMQTYPNARIICILPNFAKYEVGQLDEYCERIKDICDLLGVPYIDARISGITPYNKSTYMPDQIHYNLEGSERLADLIITKMLYDVSMR